MVVTFYSFKGGVGRSMALVNVAEILADAGYHVVVCDFDLEAPGLERYLFDTAEESSSYRRYRGVIDLLEEYRLTLTEGRETKLPEPFDLTHRVDDNRRNSGSLRLLTAGSREGEGEPSYARKVQGFNWTDFYDRWAGGAYIEFFRRNVEERADITLLDSRTGVTEHGGVCTHHLADLDVLLTAANDLNVVGTAWMAERLSRESVIQLRDGRKLFVLPVASRIEQSSQKNELSTFRANFLATFSEYVPTVAGDPAAVLAACEIPYIPYYAFTERVVAREPKHERHRELYEAYYSLAQAVVSVGVGHELLAPPPQEGWLRPPPRSASASVEEASLSSVLLAHKEWLASSGVRGRMAVFAGRDLTTQDLSNVVLRRADFSAANLERATLWRADLGEANLSGASMIAADLKEVVLDGANLQDAILERARLFGARAHGCRLARAQLRLADLTKCDLTGSDLTDASLDRTDLSGAVLTGVVGLTRRQVESAIVDGHTQLPALYDAGDTPQTSQTAPTRYDGFVSYSHAADGRLAPRLCRGLERLPLPKRVLGRSRLRMFRDDTSLATSPTLSAELEAALRESDFFLLMASPESAESPWAKRELDVWLVDRSIAKVLIILTGGDIVWNEDTGDFDWTRTTALPDIMRGRYRNEPFIVDLRWIQTDMHLSTEHPRFADAVATIAAVMTALPKDLLAERIVRRQHQRMMALASLLVVFVVLLVATSFLWSRTNRELGRATEEIELRRQFPEFGTTVINEQFDGNKNQWRVASDPDSRFAVEGGHYSISSDTTNAHFSTVPLPLKGESDFQIRCRVTKRSGVNEYFYGLVWGLKDEKNFFVLSITGDGNVAVARSKEGSFLDYIDNKRRHDFVNRPNSTNELLVRKEGGRIRLFVNGHQVHEMAFEPFFGDRAGFVLYNRMSLEFDDFVVTTR